MLYIYDTVLKEIKKDIGDYRPERGGALLGEPGKPIVTKFIFDSTAETTASTYSPSRRLNQLVKEVEENEGLEYKGIIHSHPGSFDRPSGQDLVELKTGLSINQHMPFYLVPIITMGNSFRELEPNELAIEHMKVSFYAGFREEEVEKKTFSFLPSLRPSRRDVVLRKLRIQSIPIGEMTSDLEILSQTRGELQNPQVFIVEQENHPMLAATITVNDHFDLLILVDCDYPACKPSILVTNRDGEQEEFQMDWTQEKSFIQKLDEFILSLIKNGDESSPILTEEDQDFVETSEELITISMERVVTKRPQKIQTRKPTKISDMPILVEVQGTKVLYHKTRSNQAISGYSVAKLFNSKDNKKGEEY